MKLTFWKRSSIDPDMTSVVHEIECDNYREGPLGVQLLRFEKLPPGPPPGTFKVTPSKPRRASWWVRWLGADPHADPHEDLDQAWIVPAPTRHFMTVSFRDFDYYEIER